ncbi:NAD kinase [Alphaproteobacteria bacterium]|nr:NAD kinase [Alphaproteobacteria bacterium]
MLKIHFIASPTKKSQKYLKLLLKEFKNFPLSDANLVVALGGDGFLLRTLHDIPFEKKIYGINCGGLGFLMNTFSEEDLSSLKSLIDSGQEINLHPLTAEMWDVNGIKSTHHAFNEVSLMRSSAQAAHLSITVNGHQYLESLVCDGVLLSTPAGSTAYNYSANGPILPLESNVLALTPICPFRPRRWKGALLNNKATVEIEIDHEVHRPVSVVSDFVEIQNIKKVKISRSQKQSSTLIFNKKNNLEHRILKEQFEDS